MISVLRNVAHTCFTERGKCIGEAACHDGAAWGAIVTKRGSSTCLEDQSTTPREIELLGAQSLGVSETLASKRSLAKGTSESVASK